MKKFIAIILAALVLFCFTACSSNESTTENTETTTTIKEELRFIEISKTENNFSTEIIYVDRETRVMYIQKYIYATGRNYMNNSGMSVLYGADGLPLIYDGELKQSK